MEQSKAISRATKLMTAPHLTSDFNARLMERVTAAARRQRRRQLAISVAACISIIAIMGYAVTLIIELEMPQITSSLSDWNTPGDKNMVIRLRAGYPIAIIIWGMFIADMFIRQHYRMKRLKK